MCSSACTTLTCYDPDLPIHLKYTVELIKKSNIYYKCNICNEKMEKCLFVCENGCICCKDCEPDYFTNGSRRSKICKQCNGKALDFPIDNPIADSLIKNLKSIEVEMSHGLTQIKNHGYVTEDMANGGVAPDWVPISKNQAMKEVMEKINIDVLNKTSDENGSDDSGAVKTSKIDKRKRSAYTEEEWKEIQKKRLSAFKEKQKTKKQKIEGYDNLVIIVEQQKLELDEKNAKIKYLEEKLQTSFSEVELQV